MRGRTRTNQYGFTMIELIVVVAVLGILGVMLVPSYERLTTKARLTTDITLVKTLSQTAATYRAEQGGKHPTEATTNGLEILCQKFKATGYIDDEVSFQTSHVKLSISEAQSTGKQHYQLDVSEAVIENEAIKEALNQMDKSIDQWIIGYTPQHSTKK